MGWRITKENHLIRAEEKVKNLKLKLKQDQQKSDELNLTITSLKKKVIELRRMNNNQGFMIGQLKARNEDLSKKSSEASAAVDKVKSENVLSESNIRILKSHITVLENHITFLESTLLDSTCKSLQDHDEQLR